MSERSLASIKDVLKIEAIPNADFIVLATIQGWKCITKLDEFEVGQKALFLEPDSFILPESPLYDMVSFVDETKVSLHGNGRRIRSKKLRKVISQGLAIPINDALIANIKDKLEDIPDDINEFFDANSGPGELSEALRIVKYEPMYKAQSMPTDAKGTFPTNIPKTDAERIQNIVSPMEIWDNEVNVTVKYDGSSITFFSDFEKEWNDLTEAEQESMSIDSVVSDYLCVGLCSRNLELKTEGDGNFHMAMEKYKINELLTKLYIGTGRRYAIQAELLAPSIQKNKHQVNGIEIRVFSMYSLDDQVYLGNTAMKQLLDSVGAKIPFAENYHLDGVDDLDELIEQLENDKKLIEGIVIRPVGDHLPSEIVKVIKPSYAVKQESRE